jgi:methylenetetrahydrofolate--tRNA-(uracil-5-)-methyltransferase
MTEAHETADVAELVCSNSLKSDEPTNAHGLLKAELRVLGSVLLECAERARVPGGKALVVDRRRFSAEVQRALDDAGIEVVRQEVTEPDFTTKTPRHKASADYADKGRGESSTDSTDCADDPGKAATKARKTRNGPYGESADYADEARNGTDSDITVVATGPLTSPPMADALQAMLGTERLFFYDAIAPIVATESLDMSRVFEGSRYGADGPADNAECKVQNADCKTEEAATSRQAAGSGYLNCPMSEEEYGRFVSALRGAELHPLHEFENDHLGKLGTVPQSACIELGAGQSPFSSNSAPQFFEGCLPVEEIARRGRLALAFGPMKPVGLVDTRTLEAGENGGQSLGAPASNSARYGPRFPRRPFAVVQLRRENAEGTMYNLVGFQTRLRQGEQERVFRMIPGLEKATFLRFGSIHRNTYIDSPKVLLPTLQTRVSPVLLVAGQLSGVEGYVESIGAGLVAGVNAARLARGDEPVELPREMMLGSLLRYIAGFEEKGIEGARDREIKGSRENAGQSPAAYVLGRLGHDPNSADGIGSCPARFQPMNANFGLLPALAHIGKWGQSPGAPGGAVQSPFSRPQSGTVPVFRLRGRDKRRALAERALESAHEFALTVADKRA